NVVIYRQTGAGKSSLINLIARTQKVPTSDAEGCFTEFVLFLLQGRLSHRLQRVFDTIGIEESGLEKKRYHAAVANAYRFVKTLDAEDGVDLLLFCVRACRITTALREITDSLMDSSHKKVPIVIAATNLEQRMEDWWK
ncbi:uncharacterized protein F5891DRAFT_944579, partial [Suillus fuscotomentosus]